MDLFLLFWRCLRKILIVCTSRGVASGGMKCSSCMPKSLQLFRSVLIVLNALYSCLDLGVIVANFRFSKFMLLSRLNFERSSYNIPFILVFDDAFEDSFADSFSSFISPFLLVFEDSFADSFSSIISPSFFNKAASAHNCADLSLYSFWTSVLILFYLNGDANGWSKIEEVGSFWP